MYKHKIIQSMSQQTKKKDIIVTNDIFISLAWIVQSPDNS